MLNGKQTTTSVKHQGTSTNPAASTTNSIPSKTHNYATSKLLTSSDLTYANLTNNTGTRV